MDGYTSIKEHRSFDDNKVWIDLEIDASYSFTREQKNVLAESFDIFYEHATRAIESLRDTSESQQQ